MLQLLMNGQVALFSVILIALIISLSFHEFGHAYTAKLFGDRTAESMGRVSLNPMVHIDPTGLVMLLLIGFGYAKPVPTDPRNFTSKYASLFVSAAGPGANFILAFIAINVFAAGYRAEIGFFSSQEVQTGFLYFSQINLILMIFNLIPLGSLDGHYILPYFLPETLAKKYTYYNARYGDRLFLVLIVASILGLPIFKNVLAIGQTILPFIIIV